jgi:hypothetical protein
MLIHCLISIMRAGWIKTASIGRQTGRDDHLIQTNDRQDQYTRKIPKRPRHVSQARFMGIVVQDELLFRVLGHPEDSSAMSSLARLRRLVNAERVSFRVAFTSAGRAIKIRSQPEAIEGMSVRMASRSNRFARLRWTAVPVVFPAVIPTFKCSFVSLACATNTTSGWA